MPSGFFRLAPFLPWGPVLVPGGLRVSGVSVCFRIEGAGLNTTGLLGVETGLARSAKLCGPGASPKRVCLTRMGKSLSRACAKRESRLAEASQGVPNQSQHSRSELYQWIVPDIMQTPSLLIPRLRGIGCARACACSGECVFPFAMRLKS